MSEKPIIFSAPMIRAILEGKKTMTRRIVKIGKNADFGASNPKHCDYDWSRAVVRPHLLLALVSKGETLLPFLHVPFATKHDGWEANPEDDTIDRVYPRVQVGDRLWVRETWADTNGESGPMISYKAGGDKFLMDSPEMLCKDGSMDYRKTGGCKFTMWCGDLRHGEEGHSWRSPLFMPRWASRLTLEVTGVRVERVQEITQHDCFCEGLPASLNPEAGFLEIETKHSCPEVWFEDVWECINGIGSWERNDWVWVYEFKVVAA